MPKPTSNQTKDEYIKSFMSDQDMIEKYPDEKQRYAIAISEWESKEVNKLSKIKKAKKLSDVKVKYISILTDDTQPSNMTGVIVKSKDGVNIDCEIKKFDEIKGLLYVQPMIALKSDTDNEYYENEDVEKAAHEFLKGDLTTPSDINHNLEPVDGVKVVESYVNKSNEAWVWETVLDISKNEDLMTKAKENKINGVSIYGTAKVSTEDNPAIKSKAEKSYSLLDILRNKFKEKMNAGYCWLEDILTDGTAIFEIEYKENDEWKYKYYKQAYSVTENGVELIGEAKEVVEVSSYIEKARKEINVKKGVPVIVEIGKEKLEEMSESIFKQLKSQFEELSDIKKGQNNADTDDEEIEKSDNHIKPKMKSKKISLIKK